jgi:predicted nucleic acid-binding protein
MVANPPPEPPRIFLDASILVAGSASYTGASRAILTLGELGLLKLVVCPHVLQESERNITRKLPEALPYYRRLLQGLALETVDDASPETVAMWAEVIEAKDAPVLAAAIAASPHRLVTLDPKHFLDPPQVAERSGLAICTPAELLQEIRTLMESGLTARVSSSSSGSDEQSR